MKKVVNWLFYGGLTKDEYHKTRSNLAESNRINLIYYCVLTLIGMSVLLILSFFLEVLASSRMAYLVCDIVGLLMLILAVGPAKKYSIITVICVYAFTAIILAFGIVLGTFVEPNQASASYGIVMFAAPLLFANIAFVTGAEVIASILAYCIAAYFTQSPDMFAFNLSFVIPYGVVSVVFCSLIMNSKIKAAKADIDNKILSEKDQLTGLYNRRCYEQKLTHLRQIKGNYKVLLCALDINGLKTVNDTLGHKAGDELICAASDCIEKVFGRYGTCYRIGGDEFFAIIEGESPKISELENEFYNRCQAFHGVLVTGLSVSLGITECYAANKVSDAVSEADALMYKNKDKYYNR